MTLRAAKGVEKLSAAWRWGGALSIRSPLGSNNPEASRAAGTPCAPHTLWGRETVWFPSTRDGPLDTNSVSDSSCLWRWSQIIDGEFGKSLLLEEKKKLDPCLSFRFVRLLKPRLIQSNLLLQLWYIWQNKQQETKAPGGYRSALHLLCMMAYQGHCRKKNQPKNSEISLVSLENFKGFESQTFATTFFSDNLEMFSFKSLPFWTFELRLI